MVFGVPTAAYVLDPFAKKVLNDHPKSVRLSIWTVCVSYKTVLVSTAPLLNLVMLAFWKSTSTSPVVL